MAQEFTYHNRVTLSFEIQGGNTNLAIRSSYFMNIDGHAFNLCYNNPCFLIKAPLIRSTPEYIYAFGADYPHSSSLSTQLNSCISLNLSTYLCNYVPFGITDHPNTITASFNAQQSGITTSTTKSDLLYRIRQYNEEQSPLASPSRDDLTSGWRNAIVWTKPPKSLRIDCKDNIQNGSGVLASVVSDSVCLTSRINNQEIDVKKEALVEGDTIDFLVQGGEIVTLNNEIRNTPGTPRLTYIVTNPSSPSSSTIQLLGNSNTIADNNNATIQWTGVVATRIIEYYQAGIPAGVSSFINQVQIYNLQYCTCDGTTGSSIVVYGTPYSSSSNFNSSLKIKTTLKNSGYNAGYRVEKYEFIDSNGQYVEEINADFVSGTAWEAEYDFRFAGQNLRFYPVLSNTYTLKLEGGTGVVSIQYQIGTSNSVTEIMSGNNTVTVEDVPYNSQITVIASSGENNSATFNGWYRKNGSDFDLVGANEQYSFTFNYRGEIHLKAEYLQQTQYQVKGAYSISSLSSDYLFVLSNGNTSYDIRSDRFTNVESNSMYSLTLYNTTDRRLIALRHLTISGDVQTEKNSYVVEIQDNELHSCIDITGEITSHKLFGRVISSNVAKRVVITYKQPLNANVIVSMNPYVAITPDENIDNYEKYSCGIESNPALQLNTLEFYVADGDNIEVNITNIVLSTYYVDLGFIPVINKNAVECDIEISSANRGWNAETFYITSGDFIDGECTIEVTARPQAAPTYSFKTKAMIGSAVFNEINNTSQTSIPSLYVLANGEQVTNATQYETAQYEAGEKVALKLSSVPSMIKVVKYGNTPVSGTNPTYLYEVTDADDQECNAFLQYKTIDDSTETRTYRIEFKYKNKKKYLMWNPKVKGFKWLSDDY